MVRRKPQASFAAIDEYSAPPSLAATVKDIHQMAKTYGVVYLLEKCEKHILGSMELSLADKLALADEVDNNKLFVSVTHDDMHRCSSSTCKDPYQNRVCRASSCVR